MAPPVASAAAILYLLSEELDTFTAVGACLSVSVLRKHLRNSRIGICQPSQSGTREKEGNFEICLPGEEKALERLLTAL